MGATNRHSLAQHLGKRVCVAVTLQSSMCNNQYNEMSSQALSLISHHGRQGFAPRPSPRHESGFFL